MIRMRRCAGTLFVCGLTFLAAPARAAQSSTEDGIRAMLRGDYTAAARALRPLADDEGRPDAVAQFFLALLYDTGLGVKTDMARACGLFLRSAAQAHPFTEQSAAIAASMQEQLGGGASLLCVAEERWRGGPPQAFVLGPDHRVVFADTTVRVIHGEQEQQSTILHSPVNLFLPIQYSPLAVTRPAAARRHFFQWFQWMPDAPTNPSAWTLGWFLMEVVGHQWVVIAGEKSLAVVNGASPPSSYDLSTVVRLRVNAKGEAEFTITGGASPRTEVIPVHVPLMSLEALFAEPIVTVSVPGPSAQTGTADGVAALARGDHQRAVEILRPLAEDWRSRDIVAQFFLAGLYDTGRGVPVDPLRACALYQRAASNFDSPFGRQAMALFALSMARGIEFNQECQRLANVGFDNGFEPVTFDLGPGHSVHWTLAGATVTYDGRTRREELPLAMPGARVLPLRHTELTRDTVRSGSRHFIEMFIWQPTRPDRWDLQWHVFEVVGSQIIRIDTPQPLVSIEGVAPPSAETFDARSYATLRVNDEGTAEWAVLEGEHRRVELIESEAERREVRQEKLARDGALKQVDWKRRHDVNRSPTLAYADADGCGLLQLYGWTADRAESIGVTATGSLPGSAAEPGTYDLARDVATITVVTRVYDAPQRRFDFCSDVSMPLGADAIGPVIWQAVAGTLTIGLSPPGIRARSPHLRRATITLSNVVLRNAAGTTLRMPGPVRLTAIVGGFGG